MKATGLLKILRPVVHIYTYTKSATSVLLILRKMIQIGITEVFHRCRSVEDGHIFIFSFGNKFY